MQMKKKSQVVNRACCTPNPALIAIAHEAISNGLIGPCMSFLGMPARQILGSDGGRAKCTSGFTQNFFREIRKGEGQVGHD